MTIIECAECNTKLIASNYGSHNACDTCACRNIQLIHLDPHQPSKLKGFITLRYNVSYPIITEILLDSKDLVEEPEKKLGFK